MIKSQLDAEIKALKELLKLDCPPYEKILLSRLAAGRTQLAISLSKN